MLIRKIFILISLGILGTTNIIALGSADSCDEPAHNPPSVTTSVWKSSSDDMLENKIRLGGQVNPQGSPTSVWFEYGKTKNFNTLTGFIYIGRNREISDVKIFTKEIKPNTTYSYRLVAENEYGVSYGEVETFQTASE